jgi:putative tryptophan/tyrosine transport system substrate-binding protein
MTPAASHRPGQTTTQERCRPISGIANVQHTVHELGWTDGRTVAIKYRWSEGRSERVAEIAAEFVQQKVDVIVTYGAAVATFKQATTSIPIVLLANDPVGSGLVTSLSRPGGNVTGVSL